MSKLICGNAIGGALRWVARAESALEEAITAKGESHPATFPDTAYFLPITYSLTGLKAATLGDLRTILTRAKTLLPERPTEQVWLPYLGKALDAGAAALFACEIIEACKYVAGPHPVDGIWLGAASDVIMRERGVEFVDGTAPGFAAVTGAAPDADTAVKIARELQEKNIYVFMGGATNGVQFAEQLASKGIQLGWETRLVPFGKDTSALVYALGFANRAALSFGGVKPGDFRGNLRYTKDRIFAFVLAFGEVDEDKYAIAAGAINYGFPVIADTDIPQILPTGVCTYEHVVSQVPHESMVDRALEVRGCKIKITKVPIPVPYGPAFEGERIRKQDMQVEFGGNITPAFEYVTTVDMDTIDDGVIDIIGPDVDQVPPGSALPLAIWVEVAGRKMQPDFESILERQIHHLTNGAEGIWHMGQRDIVWTRISKAGYDKGLRLRHYGEILHAKFLSNFPAIVDKVKVTLITDEAEVNKRIGIAREVYRERNLRLAAMTDESVDLFYSCLLCQSFAPNHVCVITPERLGLCGAYNWLDGKAAFEIDETGPNQPVKKGELLDPVRGVYTGVNDYVAINSHRAVESIALYSIMNQPMTSCGCFEVILAYVPECNGVMAVNREYTGDTPAGMTFSTLAGNVGGGQQTPGFMGCGKVYLTSKKFLLAEGGHRRLVWMTTDLKKALAADLDPLFTSMGMEGFMDRVADETVSVNPGDIRAHLEKVSHPALSMTDMMAHGESDDMHHLPPEAIPSKGAVPEPRMGETHANPRQHESEKALSRAPESDDTHHRLLEDMKKTLAREIVADILNTLGQKYGLAVTDAGETKQAPGKTAAPAATEPSRDAVKEIKSFTIKKQHHQNRVRTVTLGATKADGGTRKAAVTVGGASCMPFHTWEGEMPHRPAVAMEVFDAVSEKYPPVLKSIWGDLIKSPAAMAKVCVEKYGADLVSVRLDGTHPERGNRSPEEAAAVVRSVLEAVEVPLIVTGHNHYESVNAVFKEIARSFAGENLLFNWVEQDNYRTIAGAALAFGHTLAAQSPIDVNIAKQLNILLGNMDVSPDRVVIDPMTGAMGYGLEYCYSVMERIRLTGLGGDPMLTSPMIVSPGQECAKIKEFRAEEKEFPAWGNLSKRAMLWETSTATSFLYAGADILIMYHPEAALAVKKTIIELMR